MDEIETSAAEEAYPMTVELSTLFRVMSKPDALRILFLAGRGIRSSTHAIEELGISSKRYYARLNSLLDSGLVKKADDAYRQTALGRMVHDRFLPVLGKAVNAKEELEFLADLEGTEMETGVRKIIEEDLGISIFTGAPNVKILEDYEALVVEVLDICDSAEESILLASNYFDVRVMEATIRSQARGIDIRIIMGKKGLSSKLNQLRTMLSLEFAKAVISFASKADNINEMARIVDLNYSFCVVDGQRSILKVPDTANGEFVAAFSVNDQKISKRLTDSYEELWKNGESHTALKFLNSLKSG